MAEFLERLCGVLEWNDSSFSNTVHDKYYCHLTERLEAAVAAVTVSDPDAGEAAHLLLEALPPAQRLDFISAPHIAASIISPEVFRRSESRNFFLKALGIAAGCVSDHDAPLYNQRGELVNGPHEVPPNNDYRISFGGDLPIPFMDRGGNSLSPILGDDAQHILDKVTGAGNLVRNVNEKAYAFSRQYTEVLVFRYESQYPADFSSGSFQTLPGFSLICNCHLTTATEAVLADAIIHEAIHSIIYQFESFGEPLRRKGKRTNFQVVSPWTGTTLGVESFAQACLVWFGLLHFWKSACDHGKEPVALYERAKKGFVSPNYASVCHSTEAHLSADVALVLAKLQSFL
ncbi:MAG: hypothetical protein LAO76_14185 [Acidobacteriia bacterium]|nr:hypothetical protein [Terriglobia bacterium]